MSHQKIEVFYHVDAGSQPQPERFIWSGRTYQVEDIGRRWDDEAGHHILVMANGSRVYELILDPTGETWFIKPGHAPHWA
jgi:hypothetical protein